MRMTIAAAMGFVTGILIVFIIGFLLLKLTKKDGKIKCNFDERQELARGKGFKYGFFTVIICDVLMGMLNMFAEQNFFHPFVSHFLGIYAGIAVFAVYCIWNDAYISLNENRKALMGVFGVMGALNFVVWYFSEFYRKGLSTVGEIIASDNLVNLLAGILFVIVFATSMLKAFLDKREE